MIDADIWLDQMEFNRQLRPDPSTPEERMALTKEFTLHMMAEAGSMLSACGAWKMHRRHIVPENREQVRAELIDQFKYWMSLVQAQGFSPEEMRESYWVKSAAVRQRHAEEHLRSLDGRLVILDLDNVLCDYITGMCDWLLACCRIGSFDGLNHRAVEDIRRHRWLIDAETLGVTKRVWRTIKHHFRTTGLKRTLPTMPGARAFVEWCRAQGLTVVILTSRPIDRYHNLYHDTVYWLEHHDIHADFVWWGTDKPGKLWEVMNDQEIRDRIVFAVDDDPQFIGQYQRAEIPAYWLTSTVENESKLTRVVHELSDIIRREGEDPWHTKTQSIVPTLSTPESSPGGTLTTDPTLSA